MITPEQRLFAPSGELQFEPDDPSWWHFLDFDTRKWILFEGPTDPYGNDDDQEATKALLPILDQLDKHTTKVTFSRDGKSWMASQFPKDDVTPVLHFPSFEEQLVGSFVHETIAKDKWTEIDRLGPGVDLIRLSSHRQSYVFKYILVAMPIQLDRLWRSAFIHRAVSAHQNVVSFSSFVVDGAESKFVGYTTNFIPGGSLDRQKLSVISTKWIQQLMDLVDYLNIDLGVAHQDIAARNLLFDSKENRILLFDFGAAAFRGSADIYPQCDDVADLIFTIYELLTGDKQYNGSKRRDRQLKSIMDLHSWPLATDLKLDQGTTTLAIKDHLKKWAASRKATDAMSSFEPRIRIFCPNIPRKYIMRADSKPTDIIPRAYWRREADPKAHIVRWERNAVMHLK